LLVINFLDQNHTVAEKSKFTSKVKSEERSN